jgi:hypothetical protein
VVGSSVGFCDSAAIFAAIQEVRKAKEQQEFKF